MQIKEIYDFFDYLAPFETAEEWDNCGLAVGSLSDDVKKVLVALDVTNEVLDYANNTGAGLVVTHHPAIFHPLNAVSGESLIYKAIKNGTALLSSHTCLDKANGGVNDVLARVSGITEAERGSDPFLFIGKADFPSAADFAAHLKIALGGAVRYCDCKKPIKKVGFCSGSGADLLMAAKEAGCDSFLTGDASHHDFLDAAESGVSLFAAGHFETEYPVTEYLYNALKTEFSGRLEVERFNQITPVITL